MENKEYIPISEFAKLVGVSRQAVYQRLDRDLTGFVKSINGRKCVSIKVIPLFEQKQNVNQVLSNCQLDNQVDNSYIQFLQSQVENLTRLLDQAQKLQALDRQKLETKVNDEKEINKLRDEIEIQKEGIVAYRRKFESEQDKNKELEKEIKRLKNRSFIDRLLNK